MTTIELPTDLAQQLEAEAKRRGTTVDALAVDSLRGLFPAPVDDAPTGGSLADFLGDFIGAWDGPNEPLSENTGEQFTEYVVDKHRRGKL